MRAILAIARKELAILLTTPVAWVAFMVIAFFSAQLFVGALDAYRTYATRLAAVGAGEAAAGLNLTDGVVVRLFGSVGVFLVITAPFLSMRLLAEEVRHHTLELLLTVPVRPVQLVLGKYLAALAMVAVSVALVAVFPALLGLFAHGAAGGPAVEWRTVACGLVGLLLLGAMCMAVGLFTSALTGSVVVAALLSLVVLLALWVLTVFTLGAEGPARDLALGLSSSEHLAPFLQGRPRLQDLVYFLSFVTLGLWLTDRAIEARRWG